MNVFATFFPSSIYDENDDFEWKNMNFDRKMNDFFTVFHDHEYNEIDENIDFSLKNQ